MLALSADTETETETALPTPRRPSAIDFFGGATTEEERNAYLEHIYALYRREETVAPAESGVQLVGVAVTGDEEAVG